MAFLQILGIALVGVLLVTVTKNMESSISMILVVAVGVILLALSANYIVDIIKVLNSLAGKIDIELEYFFILIKAIVIAYLTEFISQFALDNGQSSIASKVQLVGKLAIFYVSLPIITSIFNLVEGML